MNFRKKRNPNVDVEELDITSLLDILVILLVFLLQNFNDSDLSVDLVEELILPYSKVKEITHNALVLQGNAKQDIYINNKLVGNLSDIEIKGEIIKTLNEIKAKESNSSVTSENSKGHVINFVFDKTLAYKHINKVLRIVDETGYTKYKFIIQGDQ